MIKYVCKYCGHSLGQLNQLAVSEKQLGLQTLTRVERQSIITYMPNGDMVANVICEYCQESLEENPDLLLVPNPLQ